MFLKREFPTVEFERYADDAVVHCVTERQAKQVWAALTGRLAELGLELHPDKTKIVYCKDSKRHGTYETVSFKFLGYTFRPRSAKGKRGNIFTSFSPAISPEAVKSASRQVSGWRIHRRTSTTLDELAAAINPIVAGWINFYGLFGRVELYPLLRRINTYLMRWARNKYKRLRGYKRFYRWWTGLLDREPELFTHWRLVRAFNWRG
jgi:RNA-directed DNA polymerase